MGGSKAPWINRAPNLLALCGSGTTGCHGLVERHRDLSYRFGWLVHRGVTLPAERRVFLFVEGVPKWVLLTDWCTYADSDEPVAA
jgi:hypothetical protein